MYYDISAVTVMSEFNIRVRGYGV